MATSFYDLFINFSMVGLMILCIFGFVITTQHNAGINNPVNEHPLINTTYNKLGGNLSTFENRSETQKTLFEEEDPKISFGGLLFFSIVSSGKVFNGMIGSVFTTLLKLPAYIGIPKVVIGVIVSIVVFIIVLTLWLLYKAGG